MKRLLRRLAVLVLLLAVVGALAYALYPAPVPVEVARIDRGPLRVTVDEDGRTRIKEQYTVYAPLAGRLTRITLKPGDPVEEGKTLMAAIEPQDPSLLDPRALAEAQARADAAQAALERTGAAVTAASAALELAQNNLARLREAAKASSANPQEMDEAVTTQTIRSEELRAATFARDIARFELAQAQAALIHSRSGPDGTAQNGDLRRFEIHAPITGRVLRVLQESAAVVAPGHPLIQIGDPTDLEVEVDVLSTDAVAIRPGAPVSLERWGGETPLRAVVRLVEPQAFTKVSALGVEEQRVYVIIDFADPPASRAGLGDGFRVEARIVVWEERGVLRVPTGALFRDADSWAVFAIEGGRARIRRVNLGRRNADYAQVVSGLSQGDPIILYPSDKVHANARVAATTR